MHGDRTHYWLWGILAVALTLRVIAGVLVQEYVSRTPGRLCLIAGDAEGYWELGDKLARGQNFEIYQPPRRVLRMPGFPALLAISIAAFGKHAGPARLLLAVIGTLACGAVYWLGAQLFGRQVGLIAAALAAVSPTFIVTSVMILSETAFALGLLLSLITLGWLIKSRPNAQWQYLARGCVAGLCGAVACYVRPSWLLFPVAAAGWFIVLAIRNRNTAKRPARTAQWEVEAPAEPFGLGSLPVDRGAAGDSPSHLPTPGIGTQPPQSPLRLVTAILAATGICLGLAAGLAPWTWRNFAVTGGHFVPTTLWMGPSLYDGLNPGANGDSHMEFLQHDALYQTMSEYDVDRHYRREAWNWAAQNPGRVLHLAWVKSVRYWNLWPNAPQFDSWPVRLVLLAYLVPVFASVCLGLIVGRATFPAINGISWGWVLILTLAPILYFAVLHTLFVSSLRYRLPAEYPLLVLAGVGMRDVITRMGIGTYSAGMENANRMTKSE